jgi:hypothetical protein
MRSQLKFKLRKSETPMHFIEPEEKTMKLSKKAVDFLAFKRFISRNIIAFCIVLAAFLTLFRYLYSLTHTYKSEVIVSFSGFEIPEYDEQQNSRIPGFAQMKDGMSRMYAMIYSKEMFDHLIKKYSLFDHFGLDKADATSYIRLRSMLKSNISIFQEANKVLTIKVSDPVSGKMCADIANDIVIKSNEMNKKYITEKIENRILLYTRLHDEIKAKTEADIESLKPKIDQLREVLANYKMKSPEVEQSAMALNDLSRNISSDISQLVQISKVSSWSLSSMDNDVMSNVMVLQDALPGETEENIPSWLLIPFAFISSFFITLFIFNLLFVCRPYFSLLTA